jgi:hypothetical protein
MNWSKLRQNRTSGSHKKPHMEDEDMPSPMPGMAVGDNSSDGISQRESDRLLDIIGNNLGDVSIHVRQSVGEGLDEGYEEKGQVQNEMFEDDNAFDSAEKENRMGEGIDTFGLPPEERQYLEALKEQNPNLHSANLFHQNAESFRGFHSSARQSERSKQPTTRPSLHPHTLHFEFKMIGMYLDWFEEEHRGLMMDGESIIALIGEIDSESPKKRVGALCTLYKALYNYELDRLDDLQTILMATIDFVAGGTHRDCPYSVYVALELIYFIGPVLDLSKFVPVAGQIIQQMECEEIQRKAIRLLFSLGAPGLRELLSLCSHEHPDIRRVTMLLLVNEPVVIETILVPSLLNQFHGSDTKQQLKALCAIGKLGHLASRSETVPILSELLLNSTIDKTLIVAAMRSLGEKGEKELNRVYKKIKVPKTKSMVCFFLGQRLPREFADHVEIVVGEAKETSKTKGIVHSKGLVCTYEGDISAPRFCPTQKSEVTEIPQLVISPVDFLVVLNRLCRLRESNQSQLGGGLGTPGDESMQPEDKAYLHYNQSLLRREEFKVAYELFGAKEETEDTDFTAASLMTLRLASEDENPDVRESAINSIGNIGLPWIEESLFILEKGLDDQAAVVRAMAAWAIGKVGSPNFHIKTTGAKLVRLLKDNYWKVRTAACITLGNLGGDWIRLGLDELLASLRVGSINRVIICETLVKLGVDGEKILLDILKRMRVRDAKLIIPILASLELSDITKPSADFVYEEILVCIDQSNPQIKKQALETLFKLKQRFRNQPLPVHFEFHTLRPVLEKGLKDPNPEIKELCLEIINSYSSGDRQWLANAASDAKDPAVRLEAIKSLMNSGLEHLNIIFFGLSDPSEAVRLACRSFLEHDLELETCLSYYSQEPNQEQLRDVLIATRSLAGYDQGTRINSIVDLFNGLARSNSG